MIILMNNRTKKSRIRMKSVHSLAYLKNKLFTEKLLYLDDTWLGK